MLRRLWPTGVSAEDLQGGIGRGSGGRGLELAIQARERGKDEKE